MLVPFWYQNNGDPLHFSETNFEALAGSSRGCIKQNVNFGPKIPNLLYSAGGSSGVASTKFFWGQNV